MLSWNTVLLVFTGLLIVSAIGIVFYQKRLSRKQKLEEEQHLKVMKETYQRQLYDERLRLQELEKKRRQAATAIPKQPVDTQVKKVHFASELPTKEDLDIQDQKRKIEETQSQLLGVEVKMQTTDQKDPNLESGLREVADQLEGMMNSIKSTSDAAPVEEPRVVVLEEQRNEDTAKPVENSSPVATPDKDETSPSEPTTETVTPSTTGTSRRGRKPKSARSHFE
jgi:hypothetical protein